MSANIWEPGQGPFLVDAENSNRSQVFTAGSGQTLFTLTSFVYTLNTGSIAVYRNGQRLVKDTDWYEDTVSTFTLNPASVQAGDVIECVSFITLGAERYAEIAQNAALSTANAALAQSAADTAVAAAATASQDAITASNAAALAVPAAAQAEYSEEVVRTLAAEVENRAALAASSALTAQAAAQSASNSAATASANAIAAEASATEASAVGVILGSIAGGLGFTDSTVYDFGSVVDTFNIFPTDYGNVV